MNAWVGCEVSLAIVCASCGKSRMCLVLFGVSWQQRAHFVHVKRVFVG